jgi:hypothetical protein
MGSESNEIISLIESWEIERRPVSADIIYFCKIDVYFTKKGNKNLPVKKAFPGKIVSAAFARIPATAIILKGFTSNFFSAVSSVHIKKYRYKIYCTCSVLCRGIAALIKKAGGACQIKN